jgi:predicted cupin superfamily sugar epimerase
VPRGTWQGSFLTAGGSFALLGTTMALGFDFSDYQSADRELLIDRYPQCADLIRRLTPVPENSCEDELHARPHR